MSNAGAAPTADFSVTNFVLMTLKKLNFSRGGGSNDLLDELTMVAHNLKMLEAYDALNSLIRARGGIVTSLRGVSEVRFELPAEDAEATMEHLLLLGHAPQFVSHELRLGGRVPTASISIYRLQLFE